MKSVWQIGLCWEGGIGWNKARVLTSLLQKSVRVSEQIIAGDRVILEVEVVIYCEQARQPRR